jgi:hypothetical protein
MIFTTVLSRLIWLAMISCCSSILTWYSMTLT